MLLTAPLIRMGFQGIKTPAWVAFLGFESYEKDPGFYKEILHISRQGMIVTGLLGMFGVIAFVAAKSFFVNATIAWSYRDIDPETTVVVWDKLVMLVLSMTCFVLARTAQGPKYGRILMVAMVIVFCISSMLDDLIIGQGYTTMFLVLFLSSAVGTMPYRGWQTFLFGLLIIVVFLLAAAYLPLLVGVPHLRMPKTSYVFVGIITIIYTGISGLLYTSRYQQFLARKRAEELKQQLEGAHASLQGSYKQLSETQDQLVRVQKDAAMGRVTAGIAHEIKNPLNFVNNFSELIAEQADELKEELAALRANMSDMQAEDINELVDNLKINATKIHNHGDRANQILAKMLDHTSLRNRSIERTNIQSLVEEYVHLSRLNMHVKAPQLDIQIKKNLAIEDAELEIAPKEVGQVVMNLMSNAFDAVEQKVQASSTGYAPVVEVSTHPVEAGIEIQIKDNGVGVATENKEKIFEPFFTTTRSTGLGLSLAHDIITQRHAGELRFESEEGEGTTFIITLPYRGIRLG